jgi:hypothetical protein
VLIFLQVLPFPLLRESPNFVTVTYTTAAAAAAAIIIIEEFYLLGYSIV